MLHGNPFLCRDARISIPGGAVGSAAASRKSFSQGGLFAKARAIIKCALQQDFVSAAPRERPHLQFYKYVECY
jgi:hypothetical protein